MPSSSSAETIGLRDYAYADSPVIFWDLYGALGHPVRATISEMGSPLLGRLMELSDAQQGTKSIWAKMVTAASGAAAASMGRKIGGQISGRESRADPAASAASAAGGTLAGEIGNQLGIPGGGRFVRGILGGLLR